MCKHVQNSFHRKSIDIKRFWVTGTGFDYENDCPVPLLPREGGAYMQRRSGFRNDCLGFSLMEVIVACVIITVLGSVTIAGFSVWLPGYRLKAAARDLYSNMQRTKMIAIKNNGDCSITFSVSPAQYVLSGVTRTVVLSEYGGGVRFQGPGGQTFSVATITFNSRGRCNSGYVYLTNERNTAYYRVGPSWSTGIIRFQTYVSGSWR
jgi:Tfp pilus assembly protein FimT